MKSDVSNYIKKCQTCLQVKVEQKSPAGLNTGTTSSLSKPWEGISCDLMGPFPRSTNGFCYIFVVADIFSKFVLIFSLRKATSTSVIQHLRDDVFLMFGTPKFIICDNGMQFKSKDFVNMVRSYNTKILYTPHYHPQSNPTERVNRVIKTMLCCYVGDNHRTWDKELQQIACAIRTAKHESTQLTPCFINFGREMSIFGSNPEEIDETTEISLNRTENLQKRGESFKNLYEDVKKRLSTAYEKHKHYYNLRRRPLELHKNQLVWRKNYVLSDASKYFTAKLAPKYIGPFKVHAKVFGGAYEIVDMDGKPKGTWHVKDLKINPDDDYNFFLKGLLILCVEKKIFFT